MTFVVYLLSVVLWVEVLASFLGFADLAAQPRYHPLALQRFAFKLVVTAVWVWLASSYVGAIIAALFTVLVATAVGHYVPRIATRLEIGIAPKDDY